MSHTDNQQPPAASDAGGTMMSSSSPRLAAPPATADALTHEGPAIVLALTLGIAGLSMGIVGAVSSSTALAIAAGSIALVLAGLCAWLLIARRKLLVALAKAERAAPVTDTARGNASHTKLEERRSPPSATTHSPSASGPRVEPPKVDTAAPGAVVQSDSPRDLNKPPSSSTAPDRPARESAGLARIGAAVSGPNDDAEETPDDLIDSRTGLLGESYFIHALNGRVAAARRHLRPLALILMDVIEGTPSGAPTHADPEVVAEIAQTTLRDADTLCRLADGRFAMILEDTPENGAIWTVERIRRRINERLENTTAWAGVACYPAHGFDGPEVLSQARRAITAARDWQQDRTEVADG